MNPSRGYGKKMNTASAYSIVRQRDPVSLVDPGGRIIEYIRLSVTDLCNLRCRYCRPGACVAMKERREYLEQDEIAAFIDIAVELGIRKLRLTGGEPLMRPGLAGLIETLSGKHPNLDIRLTTNGTLLEEQTDCLKAAGLRGVNLSLDTFNPETFRSITGSDTLRAVLRSMDKVLRSGLTLKLNVVAMKGVNDAELPVFLRFAGEHGVDVRFIEFMPMGSHTRWNERMFWPADSIFQSACRLAELKPIVRTEKYSGPARLFSVNNGKGRFGIIAPVSRHFCGACNRLRVTADGCLRACLYSDRQFPMRPVRRKLARAEEDRDGLKTKLKQILLDAVRHKPLGNMLLRARGGDPVSETRMSDIGG